MKHLTPSELDAWLKDGSRPDPYLLDVREPWEYEYCRIEGSHLIPMNQVPARVSDMPQDRPVVVICHHGVRSLHAARFLEHNGLENIYNLQGGVDAWANSVDPSMRQY